MPRVHLGALAALLGLRGCTGFRGGLELHAVSNASAMDCTVVLGATTDRSPTKCKCPHPAVIRNYRVANNCAAVEGQEKFKLADDSGPSDVTGSGCTCMIPDVYGQDSWPPIAKVYFSEKTEGDFVDTEATIKAQVGQDGNLTDGIVIGKLKPRRYRFYKIEDAPDPELMLEQTGVTVKGSYDKQFNILAQLTVAGEPWTYMVDYVSWTDGGVFLYVGKDNGVFLPPTPLFAIVKYTIGGFFRDATQTCSRAGSRPTTAADCLSMLVIHAS